MTALRRLRDRVGHWSLRRRIAAGLAVLAAGLLVAGWAVWVRPVQIRQALVDAGVTPTISFHRPWYLRWLPRKAAAYLPDGAVTRVTGVSLDPWAEGRDLSAKTLSRIRSAGALEHLDLPDAGLDDGELADLLYGLPSLRTAVLDGNPLTTASLRRLERSGLASISVDCPAVPTADLLAADRGRFRPTLLARLRRLAAESASGGGPPDALVLRHAGGAELAFALPPPDGVYDLLSAAGEFESLSGSRGVNWDRLRVAIRGRPSVDRLTPGVSRFLARQPDFLRLEIREPVGGPADLSAVAGLSMQSVRLRCRPAGVRPLLAALPRTLRGLDLRCEGAGGVPAEVDFAEFAFLFELRLDGVPLTAGSVRSIGRAPRVDGLTLRNLPGVGPADVAAAVSGAKPARLSLGPGLDVNGPLLAAVARSGVTILRVHERSLPPPGVLMRSLPRGAPYMQIEVDGDPAAAEHRLRAYRPRRPAFVARGADRAGAW